MHGVTMKFKDHSLFIQYLWSYLMDYSLQ